MGMMGMPSLTGPMKFMKCFSQMQMMACMKKDMKNNLPNMVGLHWKVLLSGYLKGTDKKILLLIFFLIPIFFSGYEWPNVNDDGI